MPAVAAIVVKKADETTNITYDALTGAAGDGSAAVWRQDTGAVAGMPVGHRASLEMKTVNSGTKSARRALFVYKYPYSTQNTVTSKYEAADLVEVSMNATMPKAIPASVLSEAVRQAMNLFQSTLIKQSLEAGYAPQ